MKSPVLRSQYTYGLNLSAVYDTRKAKKPTPNLQVNNVQKQQKILSNKSSTDHKMSENRQFESLRNTIGSPLGITDSKSSKRIDGTKRNISGWQIKSMKSEHRGVLVDQNQGQDQQRRSKKQSYSMKEGGSKEANRTFESKGINYNKIMQKVDKKQKLIQELKKLSQFITIDKAKHSYDLKNIHKDISQVKINTNNQIKPYDLKTDRNLPIKTDRFNDINADKMLFDCYSPLYLASYTPQVKDKDTSLRYLRQKIVNKLPKYRETDYKYIKNPQEEVRKQKMTYYTPKVNKDQEAIKVQTKYTPKTNTYKGTYLNLSDVKTSDKDIGSPISSLKTTQSTVKQVKTMKDVKSIASNHRNYSPHMSFKEKNLSISDFSVGKSLGQGKFGTVYQALHKQTNYLVALKKISKKSIKSNYMIDQFLLEVKIQSFCDHQNILKLYGCFDDYQYIYLVLQYMEQGTLFHQLKKRKTFSEEQAAQKLKQVAQAIKYLHQNGIAHRDIKPQNIVISHGTAKLCDLGWAAICNQRRKTYCGTFDYAAPQILQGIQYDMSVDLWCLGVLAYELMVGKAPFYHISRKQTMKKILNVQQVAIEYPSSMTRSAVSFIQNLIRKNPQERMTAENVLKHPFLLRKQ